MLLSFIITMLMYCDVFIISYAPPSSYVLLAHLSLSSPLHKSLCVTIIWSLAKLKEREGGCVVEPVVVERYN